MSEILITPAERIAKLQRENTRLRTIVGEPLAVVAPIPEGNLPVENITPVQTLVQRADGMEDVLDLIAEVML